MMSPHTTTCRTKSYKLRRRPRVTVVSPSQLTGTWGFAPAGEGPALARGQLQLEPTGQVRWTPPANSRKQIRSGLWRIDGTHMILALDGGTLFSGPVVPMGERLLWGRGVWIRVRKPHQTKVAIQRVKPLPVGTSVQPTSYAKPVVAVCASVILAFLTVAAVIPG